MILSLNSNNIFIIGELLGASTAGLLVMNLHRFGIVDSKRDEVSATEVIKQQ